MRLFKDIDICDQKKRQEWDAIHQTVKVIAEVDEKRGITGDHLLAVLQTAGHLVVRNLVEDPDQNQSQGHGQEITILAHVPEIEDEDADPQVSLLMNLGRGAAVVAGHVTVVGHTDQGIHGPEAGLEDIAHDLVAGVVRGHLGGGVIAGPVKGNDVKAEIKRGQEKRKGRKAKRNFTLANMVTLETSKVD